MSASSQNFKKLLIKLKLNKEILEFPKETRTATEAASAIGCSVDQIAKSIVFKSAQEAILVIASGKNRVDEEKVSRLVGNKIEKADADFVRKKTGFVIGGVPPFGHPSKLPTFIDEDLFMFKEVWAAAGYPNAVFKLTPQQLLKVTEAKVVSTRTTP